ncbi:MAG: hypothetical protein LBG31_05215 [Prevotellaceae bacterium]|jgi:multidrug resistance efflux pump|nr:hypothetical protein [Prevotellaceae bacterium]
MMENLFLKQVIARIKGDDAKTKAVRITRKCVSAIKAQIAYLESEAENAKIRWEDAEEKRKGVIYPDQLFENSVDYLQAIANAQEEVEKARQRWEAIQQSIRFFTSVQNGNLVLAKPDGEGETVS